MRHPVGSSPATRFGVPRVVKLLLLSGTLLLAQAARGQPLDFCEVWERDGRVMSRMEWLTLVKSPDAPIGWHRLPGSRTVPCLSAGPLELDVARMGNGFTLAAHRVWRVWLNRALNQTVVTREDQGTPGPGWEITQGGSSCEEAHDTAYPPRAGDCRTVTLASVPGTQVIVTRDGWRSLGPPVTLPTNPPFLIPGLGPTAPVAGGRCQIWEQNMPPNPDSRNDWLSIVQIDVPGQPLPMGWHALPDSAPMACGPQARAALDAARLLGDFNSICDRSYRVWLNRAGNSYTVTRGDGPPGPGLELVRGGLCCEVAHAMAYPPRANDCRNLNLNSVPTTVHYTGEGVGNNFATFTGVPITLPTTPPITVYTPGGQPPATPAVESLIEQRGRALANCDFAAAATVARAVARLFPSNRARAKEDAAALEGWDRFQRSVEATLARLAARARQNRGLGAADRQRLQQLAGQASPQPCLADRITRFASLYPAAPAPGGRSGGGPATVGPPQPGTWRLYEVIPDPDKLAGYKPDRRGDTRRLEGDETLELAAGRFHQVVRFCDLCDLDATPSNKWFGHSEASFTFDAPPAIIRAGPGGFDLTLRGQAVCHPVANPAAQPKGLDCGAKSARFDGPGARLIRLTNDDGVSTSGQPYVGTRWRDAKPPILRVEGVYRFDTTRLPDDFWIHQVVEGCCKVASFHYCLSERCPK